MKRTLWAVALSLLVPTAAHAQFGGASGRMGRGAKEEKPKKPKVAEQGKGPAKKVQPKRVSTWGEKKPIQFLQLSGYFRLRSDVFHKLHLGLQNLTNSKAPHPPPLFRLRTECQVADPPKSCKKNFLQSTNMRLHLEPTFHVHSRVRVKMTLDIFDNFVLGSTPEGQNFGATRPANAPLNAFATTSAVPQSGRNSLYDVIQWKHAWGEVDLPFGRLLFGRMPSHWGMGILANSGTCSGYARWTVHHHGDPQRCMDSDFGDIADRIMFATKIPWGLDLLIGFSWDFQASGLTSVDLSSEQDRQIALPPKDLDPVDNVNQWVVFLAHIDSPLAIKQKLARNKVVFNYGTYWVFRRQNRDVRDGQVTGGVGDQALADAYVQRKAFAMIPDLWLRLNWGKLQLEFEGLVIWGWIDNLGDISNRFVRPDQHDLNILQWAWVFKGHYRFLNDALTIGIEIGQASGDDDLEGQAGLINYRNVVMFPERLTAGVPTNSLFRFDPNYRVDLIFFRELMGTVYNATYYKVWAKYDVIKELTARLDIIYSMAMEPVATPGNKLNYGVEIDIDIEYRWPEAGFYAGIAYGVFFPLDALHRPAALYDPNGVDPNFPAKGKIAQSVQLRAQIKF